MKTPTLAAHFRLIALVLVCLAGAPDKADATTRTVSSLNDDGGVNTLRTLIGASVDGDTINFSVTGTITLTNGELAIIHSLTIIGPGPASLTVSGNNASRVFDISAGKTVSIFGLTIANGYSADNGGSIVNSGTLTVYNCILFGNTANLDGGGIYNSGTLTMNNCTLSGNTSFFNGGGILNIGTLTMNNCTLSGNTSSSNGGGIKNSNDPETQSGTLTMNNCTLSANTASVVGGGADTAISSATLHNTIVAGNRDSDGSPDIFGGVTSQGHNLIGNTSGSGGWVGSDLLNVNPLLGPLQDNGGPTFTMALSRSPISAAIDAGDDTVTNAPLNLTTDQRGRPRKSGAHVDIGAVEISPITLVVSNNNDSGSGSLRQTILDAFPYEGDTITFAPNVTGTIMLTSGQLQIGKNLSVTGPTNTGVIISGNNASRVFYVSAGTVSLSSLTIANGNAGTAGDGGGILTEVGSTLNLNNCTVSGNLATNVNAKGGGVANYGTVLATNCTFSGNQSPEGGGLYNPGAYALRNCTITSNSAVLFGGIWNVSTMIIGSTIIAGNTASIGADISGNSYVTSQGYNLIGINSSGSGITNGVNQDQAGSGSPPLNPLLGPLQNNGGPTFTHALLTGSPAIDKGKSFGLATDQRGRLRLYDFASITNAAGGDGSDIGAFELNSPILSITRAANNVVLTWNASDTGYTLQGKTNLNPALNWSGVSPAPVVVSGQNTVTNTISGPPTFYRLIQ